MMKIPEDVNTRAEDMWRIISQRIDFRGKRVVDLGCGYGEMLWRVLKVEAKEVWGIDKDNKIQSYNIETHTHENRLVDSTLRNPPKDMKLTLNLDIDGLVSRDFVWIDFDISFCFSVLPYLDDIPATLKWMSNNFPLCLIEAQYELEPYNIGVSTDDEMYRLLRENGFKCATWLGQTYVEDRDTHRSIWACSKGVYRL